MRQTPEQNGVDSVRIDEVVGRGINDPFYRGQPYLAANRRVEIGSTWTAQRVQRTALNTECKRMLLAHAFETLDCIAVEFRTHRLNTQSRRAIERLGAQLDGILRAHQRSPNGSVRDTAVYSITAPEGPTVKAHLDRQLQRPR